MTLFRQSDPRVADTVVLGGDPRDDRLYGCFRVRRPGDTVDDSLKVELVAGSGRETMIRVPEAMRVHLPVDRKLADTEYCHLDELRDNLDTMFFLSLRSGWNQTEEDIRRIVSFDPQGAFLASFRGRGFDIPAGTGTVTPLGARVSWIGMILVHPEFRRQGLANAIMRKAALHSLRNRRGIIGLDATPMGKTVYDTLGFVDSHCLWRSVVPLAQYKDAGFDRERVTLAGEGDLPDIIRYDASNFTERADVLGMLFHDKGAVCFVYRDGGGRLRGYCFARPGRIRPFVGPFYADSEEVARELVVPVAQELLRKGVSEALMDIPESQFLDGDEPEMPGHHRFISGVSCIRKFIRMYQVVDEAKALEMEKARRHAGGNTELGTIIDLAREHSDEALDFMRCARDRELRTCWGTTGPEKG